MAPGAKKATTFIACGLLAGALAFGVGSAASWLLSRPASASGEDTGVNEPLLPDLVAVTLEASSQGSTFGPWQDWRRGQGGRLPVRART